MLTVAPAAASAVLYQPINVTVPVAPTEIWHAPPPQRDRPEVILDLRELNNALGWLLNNPAPDYHGPVLGDLGGYRGKIMDGIGQVLADALAGIEFIATKDPAVNGSQPNKPATPPVTASL